MRIVAVAVFPGQARGEPGDDRERGDARGKWWSEQHVGRDGEDDARRERDADAPRDQVLEQVAGVEQAHAAATAMRRPAE